MRRSPRPQHIEQIIQHRVMLEMLHSEPRPRKTHCPSDPQSEWTARSAGQRKVNHRWIETQKKTPSLISDSGSSDLFFLSSENEEVILSLAMLLSSMSSLLRFLK